MVSVPEKELSYFGLHLQFYISYEKKGKVKSYRPKTFWQVGTELG